MLVELGSTYTERILPENPYLFPLRHQGVRDVGNAYITDTYLILRTQGYFEHIIIYTISGEGWLFSDGKQCILTENQVWISPSGIPHEYGVYGTSWHILWFCLSPNKRWNVVETMGTDVKESVLVDDLLYLFNRIYDGLEYDHFNTINEMEELCKLLLIYLERELSHKLVNPKEREIKRNFQQLFMQVSIELEKQWDIPSLMELMHHQYALGYFIRLCKTYYGNSPMHVVRNLRMQRAWELVCNTTVPIYLIAEKVGYTNPYAFSTTFKKAWGMSPRNARKQ